MQKSAMWRKRIVLAKSGCLCCVPELQMYGGHAQTDRTKNRGISVVWEYED